MKALFAAASVLMLWSSAPDATAQDALAATETRYAVSFSVRVDGVEAASGKTLMRENGATEMTLCTDSDCYSFRAELSAAPNDQLQLNAALSRNDEATDTPKLRMSRTGTAQIEISPDPANGIYVTISPVA